MFDPRRITPQSLDLVDRVVEAMVSEAGAADRSIMIIGAHCRDLLHAGFGRGDLLRSTTDVDIALAVNGDKEYQRITSGLSRSGTTNLRYLIAGIAVDVVPFGGIEDPVGTSALVGRLEPIAVFGFQEVFDQAMDLLTPSGFRVRLPSPAGYAALKLKAWCDRSALREYKDAADIATACSWYQQNDDLRASLYDAGTDRMETLIEADMDVDIALLNLLGKDIADVIGDVRVSELARSWALTDRDMLAVQFAREKSRTHPDRATAHREITALTRFLASG